MPNTIKSASALVISLPRAAASPVIQTRRRGRLPKCVVSYGQLCRLKLERASLPPEVAERIVDLAKLVIAFNTLAENAQNEAAELRQKFGAMKGGAA